MTCKRKPQIAQAFHPFRKFTGLWIPEALAKFTSISPGAKLVYGRLVRYSGQNGKCHPAVAILAKEVGLKRRQVQNHLTALEKAKLIRRIPRHLASRQTSNAYFFLWHQIFEDGVNETAPGGLHGGLSTGPKTTEGIARIRQARLKHGRFTKEAKSERRYIRELISASRKALDCSPIADNLAFP